MEKKYTKADLIKAANYGQDFQAATKWTVRFDTIEDLINDRFPDVDQKHNHLLDDNGQDFIEAMTDGRLD